MGEYVCVSVCEIICECVWVCMHMCTHLWVSMCVSQREIMCECVWGYVSMCMCEQTWVCMCGCVSECMSSVWLRSAKAKLCCLVSVLKLLTCLSHNLFGATFLCFPWVIFPI